MDVDRFKLDEKAEVEGVWRNLGEGARIKIARMMNPTYREAMRKRTEPYQALTELGQLGEKLGEEILIGALAEGILVDWEGFEENKLPLQPTMENKIRLLTTHKALREMVVAEANKQANFAAKVEKADLKN